MVEKIITWLLNKAGITRRLEDIEKQLGTLEERIEQADSSPVVGADMPSAAELLNEWINGGNSND